LRVAGILPAVRGPEALVTKEQGQDGLATQEPSPAGGIAKAFGLDDGLPILPRAIVKGGALGDAAQDSILNP
jgi:hypothetical protein